MELGCLGAEGKATAARILDRPIQPQVRHQPGQQQESILRGRKCPLLLLLFHFEKLLIKDLFYYYYLTYVCMYV